MSLLAHMTRHIEKTTDIWPIFHILSERVCTLNNFGFTENVTVNTTVPVSVLGAWMFFLGGGCFVFLIFKIIHQ